MMKQNNTKIVTKKDLVALIIKEAKQILLKEDISQELVQTGGEKASNMQGNDEIGEFYIVTHPNEGDISENIVKKVSIPHLMQKIKIGELQVENIHSICKKDTMANRQAKKILKEFNQSLQSGRKLQLEALENKRKGYQMKMDGTKHILKGKILDEDTSMKIKQIEDHISKLDNRIADLQKKIKDNKGNLKEGFESTDDLNELFGWGRSSDVMSPEKTHKAEMIKYAQAMVKYQKGEAVGKYLVDNPNDTEYFVPYILKMAPVMMASIIKKAPDTANYFVKGLHRLGKELGWEVVSEQPSLKGLFDKMRLPYER